MKRDLSIVLVDKRHHRVIAQENWGLSDDQMKGMHVHHRVHKSKGGTNDPSNLYVCSPSFHKYGWHDGDEWIEYAHKGASASQKTRSHLRTHDREWALKEKELARVAAKKSHSCKSKAYSERQRLKGLKAVCPKRSHWEYSMYEAVSKLYFSGIPTAYLIAKELKVSKWKTIHNMMKCIELGLTFNQATCTDLYVPELNRLACSPISHLISAY